MRVLFDVLGAPTNSGGMRQYAEELIAAWHERFPSDELVVVGDRWVEKSLAGAGVRHFQWASDRFPSRALGQLLVTGVVHHALHCDVTVSTSTVVSGLVPRSRRLCIVHDWRHLRRPDEFGVLQRLYRRLWTRSASRAGALISISEKTLRESREFVPSAAHLLVASGHDHARRWGMGGSAGSGGHVLTFGHHANKRPDLVIRAFARSGAASDRDLVVLGARGEFADALRRTAEEYEVLHRVRFPGFVDQATYRTLVVGAGAVVLASSDEGFGLPGSEASYFGIPFVVADDSGLESIHAAAIVAQPSVEALAEAIGRALRTGPRPGSTEAAQSWADTARGLRMAAEARLAVPSLEAARPGRASSSF